MAQPIVNLYENSESGITEIMDGPWREIAVTDLAPGTTLTLSAHAEEHAGFVISGSAEISIPGDGPFPLGAGGAFALPLTGQATIVAGADGTRLLIITLNVEHA